MRPIPILPLLPSFAMGFSPFSLVRVWRSLQRSRRALGVAAAMATVTLAAEKDVLPAVDDKWRYYKSPNFELYSRNDESDSRDLLQNLELLRAIFVERFKFVERAKLDVTVYYFRTLADFQAYSPENFRKNDFFAGFYFALPDRAVISLAPTDDPERARRLIFHEYVHHLFRAAEEDPPVWYNEGMAEIFAGMRLGKDTVELGRPPPGRLLSLLGEKLLPLETLFAVDHNSPIYRSSDHTGVFYAESWALMHYWLFGRSQLSKEAIDRFLSVAADRKKARSVDLRNYFQECFGMDYPEMQKQLERYIRGGSYHFGTQPAPKIASPKTYTMRPAPRDETRLRLADLGMRVNRSGAAKLVLLEGAEKFPDDPRVFESLGCDAMLARDEAGAREDWEKAITAGTHNIAVYRELGLLESRQWFQQFDYYFRMAPEVTDRLRGRLLKSIEYEPQQSAAYEMLAWVEAYAERPSIANVNQVQEHFSAVKQKARTLLALALVRVRLDKKADALEMLHQIDQFEPDAWTTRAGEVVAARIEGRAPRRDRITAPIVTPPPAIRAPPIEIPK